MTPSKLKQNDKNKLTENLHIERDEPEQLVVSTLEFDEPIESTQQDKVDSLIERFQTFLAAAEQMREVLQEKLRSRTVRVSAKKNPAVRDAIRRVFGENTDIVTYDMFKRCLDIRSELAATQRDKTLGERK